MRKENSFQLIPLMLPSSLFSKNTGNTLELQMNNAIFEFDFHFTNNRFFSTLFMVYVATRGKKEGTHYL